MKKREFIAAICFICIFGILVTVQVKRFVSSPSQRAGVQEYAASEEYELKKADQTGSVQKEESEPQMEARQAEAARIQEKEGTEKEQDAPFNTPPRIEPGYPEGRAQKEGETAAEAAAVIPEAEKPKEAASDVPVPRDSALTEAAAEENAVSEGQLENSRRAAEPAAAGGGDSGSLDSAGAVLRSRAAAVSETETEGKDPAQETRKASQEAASGEMLSPAAETAGQPEAVADEEQVTAQAYQRELDSTAASIKKLKSSETDTSTWSYLNLADYELKLWDDLLNRIYQDIIEHMDEAQAEELRKEEKEWIKKRDADAKKVSSRYSGGTLEGLEHTASLAKSTKERAWELLENYGSWLPQEEVPEEK